MKPFQTLYNICMNQLYKLLEKEIGNVASVNIRRVPRLKDGDDQDALDVWEMEARERGIIFDDDSPENTKAAVSNTSIARNIDLTRTNEIQSRYNLALQLKAECWELIGITRQRLGSVQASETATATNTAVSQSYAQTEPLFVAHEYVMGQLYQGIIDAAQYIESSKPLSTLSYVTAEGESAFIQVNGNDLKFRDLKVFPTNRPEDTQMFNELRQLSQAVIQNGGTLYDIIELYSTKSMREMKKTFKNLRDRQQQLQDQQQQMQQQQLEQQGQIAQAQIQSQQQQKQEEMANENYQKELDRINKKEVAVIQALGRNENAAADVDESGTADVLEMTNLSMQQAKAAQDYQLKMQDIQSKNTLAMQKLQIEKEKLQVARDNQKNDLEIAKQNAKNRSKGSSK
jgi:hypothetical protein